LPNKRKFQLILGGDQEANNVANAWVIKEAASSWEVEREEQKEGVIIAFAYFSAEGRAGAEAWTLKGTYSLKVQ
jgi:hypothetical protein